MKLEDIKKIGIENCSDVYYRKFKVALDASFDLMIKMITTGITKNDIEQAEMKLKEFDFENMEVKEDVN